MTRIALSFVALALIAGCSDDQPAAPAKQAAAPAAAPAAKPMAGKADSSGGMAGEPMLPGPPPAESAPVEYDPIDSAKLENQWWQQYSGG